MKQVRSDALGTVQRALGISGTGSPQTEFLDATLDQVIDVSDMVRRGRTLAGTEGIFRGVLRTVHAGSGTLSAIWTPYRQAVGALAPYPDVVGPDFDIWLLGASCRLNSGTGTIAAALFIQNVRQGFGIDDSGVAVSSNGNIPLAFWDTVDTALITFATTAGQMPFKRLAFRIPRIGQAAADVTVSFRSVASALATWDCDLFYGIFPVSLGQDGLG